MPQQHRAPTSTANREPHRQRAERDIIALGIVVAAILMFVGTGSTVLTTIARSYLFGEAGTDRLLSNALVLNIALVIFGWRRYAELTREIAERRHAEIASQRLAETDALTGCLNRRSLDPALDTLIETAQKSGRVAVLLMIDLDGFKRSNDAHGHQIGDIVLCQTTDRIRAIMPDDALIARLGGDEFICAMILDAPARSAAETILLRLNLAIAAPIESADSMIIVTASIGVSSSEQASVVPIFRLAQDLLHRADLAMYEAKKNGRNRFCWFEDAMEQKLRLRRQFETDMRDGIMRGEFVPYYEKQIDLETGEVIGFEMLARWHSPRFGLINPEQFISVAEEIGLIAQLSESLIAQALADAGDWNPKLSLSVNISPIQLRDPLFAQRILKLLVQANFPPSRLEIEITESCLHENIEIVRSLIASLQNQGVRVCLDDFGTGYASLAQLRALPFDRIKIDRSFVSTLISNSESPAIVEAISSLARSMDMPITAEGIESPEVLAQLRKFGKFNGQGYLYGQPRSADDTRRELSMQQLDENDAPAHQTQNLKSATT